MLFAVIVQIYIFTKNEVSVRLKIHASSAHCHSKKLQHLVSDKAKEEQVIQLFQRILWGKLNYVRTVRGEHDSLFLSL